MTDAPGDAAEAGLRYVTDDEPGIRRIRCGQGFTYRYSDGETVPHGPERDRISSLAIPPAWTDVWICEDPQGHLQATGRDDKNRKVYLYHPRWREVREAAKFDLLPAFGEALPGIREAVDAGLRKRTMSRQRVLAITVALLDESLIRVGNAQYARRNATFGLTTLEPDHIEVRGGTIEFAFPAKSGKERVVDIRDQRLARQVARCEETPGHRVFTYVREDGTPEPVNSDDVNEWLREVTGEGFSAKDFRTWGGTVAAATAMYEHIRNNGERLDPDALARLGFDAAAERLGNTRSVAQASYVHPAVPEADRGDLREAFARARSRKWLDREEVAVLRLLES